MIGVEEIDDDFLLFCWRNLRPEHRLRILSKTPKTLWLFGAGASHHYTLNPFGVPVPLANGFFEAFNNLPTSHGFSAHIGPFIHFLEHYRGISPEKAGEWRENIEDFMTSIEHELDRLRESLREHPITGEDYLRAMSYILVFNNMTFIFANVLNESQNGPSRSLYSVLTEFCGPNDTFVTFNWDTLLDRALVDTGGWNPNTGYGLKLRGVLDGSWRDALEGDVTFTTNWKLLKLHGSTNWLVPHMGIDPRSLEFRPTVELGDDVFLYWQSSLPYATHHNRWTGGYAPTTYCYYPPHIPAHFFAPEQLLAPSGHVYVRSTPRFLSPYEEENPHGVPSSPVLITPVRQKKYEAYRTTIQRLWEAVVVELESASRIVIIGYSFPYTDTRPLDLLRSVLAVRGHEMQVEIVAPGVEAIADRIGRDDLARTKEVTLHNMKLEEYLETLYAAIPPMLRRAATNDSELADWIRRIYISSRGGLSAKGA